MADFTQYTDANGTTHTVKDAKAVRQFSTMPSASDYSGLFVVYTGATTSDYTKGHRYLSDGTNWTDYGTAENMSYDNSTSGLSATDVQGAVDELEEEKVSFDAFGAEKTATITDGLATFTAYEEAPVTSLIAGIEPVQEGSGTPSPDNVRPISGHTEMTITNGTEQTEIPFGRTVYGGELNVKTGVLTVTHGIVDLGSLTWYYASPENRFYSSLSGIKVFDYGEIANILCSSYPTQAWAASQDKSVFSAAGYVSIKDSSYDSVSSFSSAMSGVQLCYELATPTTIQLSREEVFQLIGENNISADTGDIISCKYIPVGNDKACLVTDDDYGYMGGKDMALTTDGTDAKIELNGTEMPIVLQSFLKSYFYPVGLRYKNLGSSFTDAQKTAIANGDFTDFWNGDYWVINGINFRIVDNTDFQYKRGDTEFTKHGLIVMPDTLLVNPAAYLIDTANDSGNGYANCGYRTTYRDTCKTIIANAFGSDHIGTHRELMSNARGDSGASDWAWYDADVELPSEANIFGQSVFGLSTPGGSGGRNIGSQYGQFALFRLAPQWICRRQNYWLRDIVSASNFADVSFSGIADYYSPSFTWSGLRPCFILVGTTS